MRTIPSELLDRVNKKWQAPAENADPKMKVYLSKGFLNELFQVFTIQEGAELTDVDVTVKRVEMSTVPAEAFALAVNNGVASVKSKALPYDDQYPWVDEFTVASGVTAVAIEFDGFWDRDFATMRFNFVTEQVPWLFYVINGTLYAQYWQDNPIVLATGVTKVAAIRGWLPVNGQQSNDQGLIVAYILMDGSMSYRSYCIQDNGQKMWEVERAVSAFPGTVDNLALFRTNDFRVGFVAEIAGYTTWAMTERNYAGMSVWPEQITAAVTELSFAVLTIQYKEVEHIESITSEVNPNYFYICPIGATMETPVASRVTSISPRTLKIVFAYPAVMREVELKANMTIRDTLMVNYPISTLVVNGNTLTITTTTDIPVTRDAYIEMAKPESYYLGARYASSCVLPYDNFSLQAKGTPPDGYSAENLSVSFPVTVNVITINYKEMFSAHEYLSAVATNLAFVVTKVGGNPL